MENQPENQPENKTVHYTTYGSSNLWYVDNKNKLCITFTPRGGCSITVMQYLDLIGLLSDGLNFAPFIHEYRSFKLFHKYINIDELISEKYTFVKFIMNPYIRAVSSYRWGDWAGELSFRQYLIKLINNKISHFDENNVFKNDNKLHIDPQYIDGEENIITKYIKINENETYDITLDDGTLYTLDANRYISCHHGHKNITNADFCGDTPRGIVNDNLPASYKYFYDDEIKKLVETFYKNDVDKYGFTFESAF